MPGIGESALRLLQAAGSCHKGPSGASARTGPEGPKIVKNRRGGLQRGQLRADPVPNPPLAPEMEGSQFGGERCDRPARLLQRAVHRDRRFVILRYHGYSNGAGMNGDEGKGAGKTSADVKDSRRDRLKLALRENLKRRKAQARGRSDAGSSESADPSLDDASGEKPGA